MSNFSEVASGSATGTATAVATFNVGGFGGYGRNQVTGIGGSFNVATIGTLKLLSGTTEIHRWDIHNQRDIVFDPPYRFAPDATAAATLDLGVSGTVTQVYITGTK